MSATVGKVKEIKSETFDPEIEAMRSIKAVFDFLDQQTISRILRWMNDRWGDCHNA